MMLQRVEQGNIGLLPTLPKWDNLARQAKLLVNHKPRKCRPRHLVDLLFDIDSEHIPAEFLQSDMAAAEPSLCDHCNVDVA